MITEDYVSYEVAKMLKEKGFDGDVWRWYRGNLRIDLDIANIEDVPCPTHQMAMKWLRDKGVDIIIIPILPNEYNPTKHYKWLSKNVNDWAGTYEEAVEAALKYSLENLI